MLDADSPMTHTLTSCHLTQHLAFRNQQKGTIPRACRLDRSQFPVERLKEASHYHHRRVQICSTRIPEKAQMLNESRQRRFRANSTSPSLLLSPHGLPSPSPFKTPGAAPSPLKSVIGLPVQYRISLRLRRTLMWSMWKRFCCRS